MRLIAIALCALFSGSALAQVSPADMAAFKGGLERGCVNAGVQRGDPADRVRAFCSCMLGTLSASMTSDEWSRFYALSRKGDDTQQKAALAPHMAKIQACHRR
jgi:hypothetical protein